MRSVFASNFPGEKKNRARPSARSNQRRSLSMPTTQSRAGYPTIAGRVRLFPWNAVQASSSACGQIFLSADSMSLAGVRAGTSSTMKRDIGREETLDGPAAILAFASFVASASSCFFRSSGLTSPS